MNLISNLLLIFSCRLSSKIIFDFEPKLEISGKHAFREAGPVNY